MFSQCAYPHRETESYYHIAHIKYSLHAHRMFVESKTARLTVLIDPEKKEAFEKLCAAQDLTPSQVVRQLIRDYLNRNGVPWPKPPSESTKP